MQCFGRATLAFARSNSGCLLFAELVRFACHFHLFCLIHCLGRRAVSAHLSPSVLLEALICCFVNTYLWFFSIQKDKTPRTVKLSFPRIRLFLLFTQIYSRLTGGTCFSPEFHSEMYLLTKYFLLFATTTVSLELYWQSRAVSAMEYFVVMFGVMFLPDVFSFGPEGELHLSMWSLGTCLPYLGRSLIFGLVVSSTGTPPIHAQSLLSAVALTEPGFPWQRWLSF